MKYDFITIGGATLDIAFFTDKGILLDNKKDLLRQKLLAFEYGAKIKVDQFANLFGGGAANAAVNLSGLGFKTAMIAEVGSDETGRKILNNLKNKRVTTSFVKVNQKTDSGLSFIIITESGERIIFTHRGANDNFSLKDSDLKILKTTNNIYLASLTGSWLGDLKKIFSLSGPRIFWNPGEAQYEKGLRVLAPFLKKTYCLMLNRDEALALVSSDKKFATKKRSWFNNENNLLEAVKSYGPEIIVITDGPKGAYFYDGKKVHYQKTVKEKKYVDSTGIGDAYNSTFAAGLVITGGNIAESAYLASRNAASKIAHLGAQNGLLTKKELLQ